jgi:hypothetical protein
MQHQRFREGGADFSCLCHIRSYQAPLPPRCVISLHERDTAEGFRKEEEKMHGAFKISMAASPFECKTSFFSFHFHYYFFCICFHLIQQRLSIVWRREFAEI